MIDIRVQEEDFDVTAELGRMRENNSNIGAIVNFIGLVRDLNQGSSIGSMALEHYPGMTEKSISQIVEQAMLRWKLQDAIVIHRIGHLLAGDQIVFVATSSQHRAEAFASCEFIMDYLKTRAPFWKKEFTPSGSRWVASCDADIDAAKRW